MAVYYNENDKDKAAWLRELISRNVVANGQVDTRSIKEVEPEDLAGFSQCHFFAGIGVWSYALRLAGWPDDRPVWTGSCPCPSFSAAGKGGGFNDPRHLWPDWARLVRIGKPATIFGEQADDAIGYGWLDLVQTDLERENYAVGKAVLGACSVGAPHIRQRLYFVAHAAIARHCGNTDRRAICKRQTTGPRTSELERLRGDGELAHTKSERCGEARSGGGRSEEWSGDARESGDVANANGRGFAMRGRAATQRHSSQCGEHDGMGDSAQRQIWSLNGQRESSDGRESSTGRPSFCNGFWRDADWILRKRWNRDDWEWCPTEPGTFPLVAGASARVLRLRGYGDAICAPLAAEFIKAYLEVNP